ncbi:MAG: flavodoxin-dependent (E)-4-hydroxy-3-methylbut-2-enyl-diphosphate synthase [Candidatus Aminicenantes bacterium]|uniref:4-hydroxy-3-methylbut-2-en-1-yl diphosphate synthase (flavodoxin) n=1 Tax=Candidatus Saccharicenans subterraneus TaxID=2508984 RepID=A0A3E2BLE7_9BACT|nr:flavodoxin-dependent (E)-4-hydroxy-3-methylbut-2-enyl-diphosphate synthase [Candidatus Aminicenantes bacterium]RFT15541.1 MAG: 1-hydroxy-2-methyl-2-(E)-butenyl 4-diphosphate synthase [Candidatus Saccharicenans subterraneum]
MSQKPELYPRRRTRAIRVGSVVIGGGAPVVVQSMTKTRTADVRATVAQIKRLERAGCRLVRVAVPGKDDALAIREIKKRISIPLIADIHFNPRLAILALEAGADGLRINPGTIGSREKLKEVVRLAAERKAAIRVGVNSGSLEKDLLVRYGQVTAEALVESALGQVRQLEDLGFHEIKISLKASDIRRTVEAYRLLADRVDYPFHAGITEAGTLLRGSIKSAAGLALLLSQGLADTIRVSLTAPPEREVEVAYEILRSLGLESRGINFISCPGCGRTEVDLRKIATEVEKKLAGITAGLTVAVMGCPVNGPGEAREADIGVACGREAGVIFKRGLVVKRVPEPEIVAALVREVEAMARELEKMDPDVIDKGEKE